MASGTFFRSGKTTDWFRIRPDSKAPAVRVGKYSNRNQRYFRQNNVRQKCGSFENAQRLGGRRRVQKSCENLFDSKPVSKRLLMVTQLLVFRYENQFNKLSVTAKINPRDISK